MLRRQLGLGLLTLSAIACSSPTSSTPASEHPASGCPDQLFCDDFESATPGAAPTAPWTLNAGAGAEVTVTNERAVSGSNAVRLVAPAKAAAFLELVGAPVFPRADNAFFGRARFYFESAPTTEQPSVHWTFLQASGTRADDGHHAEYRYGGQKALHDAQGAFVGNQLMANYETPDFYDGSGAPGSDCWHHARARVVPLQRWVCVEWHFDGPNNTMELWLDGAPAEDLTVRGTGQGCVHQPATYPWTAPNFERVSLGWQGYQADETRTVYIDDVALGTERVGCD
jgi:hypothetical protein